MLHMFQNYPLDEQECPLFLGSFGYSTEILHFAWLQPSVDIANESLSGSSFTLKKVNNKDCTENYTLGQYPCTKVGFVLKRYPGYSVTQVCSIPLFTMICVVLTVDWSYCGSFCCSCTCPQL